MKLGLMMFTTDYTVTPSRLAQLAEQRDFESLFFPDHTHIPASRITPFPPGGELPPEYARTYDPLIALMAAADATTTLRLGTGICLVVERDPIATAKQVASLDRLSGGRLLFGVGAGWNIEELENHGGERTQRFAVMRERVQAMQAIWTEEEASFHGQHVQFERIWSWPKPLQQPYPPVLVGGNGNGTLARTVAFGDEWMPIWFGDLPALAQQIEQLGRLAAEAGREPLPITLFLAPPSLPELGAIAALGVHRCVFHLPSVDEPGCERELDGLAELLASARQSDGTLAP